MNVVQRYIFRRLLAGFVLAFPMLAVTIWLSQALRELNLVTDRGQGLMVFLEAAVLLLPGLIVIIGPVTVLIVTISTINGLNNDSELVSLGASGASPALLLKPVLALALPVALLAAICSVFLSPMAARATSSLIENVNANLITSLIRPGQFRMLGDDVIVQVADIHPDGTLEGIFIFDRRNTQETVTYIARAGAVFEEEGRQYLAMREGVIQTKQAGNDAVSVIQFVGTAINLSSLTPQGQTVGVTPNQRHVGYLLNPDPNDSLYQQNPFRYAAELHNRITIPLYVIALAVFPLAMLGQVQSARQGRGWRTTITAVVAGAALGAGLYLTGALETNAALLPVVYGIPVGLIVLSILVTLTGRRPSLGIRALFRRLGLGRRPRRLGAEA